MAVDIIKPDLSFPIKSGHSLSEKTSDADLIQLIVRKIIPERRRRATRQIKIYFTKISSHPDKKSYYIKKIEQLVKYEEKGVENE